MATGPTLQQAAASIPPVASDRARIFFYRPYNYVGSAGTPTVILDTSPVAPAQLNGAFYCDVTPGSHALWGTEYVSKPAFFSIAPGQSIYLRMDPSLAGFEINPVDANTGASEVKDMHLVAAQCAGAVSAGKPAAPAIPKAELDAALAAGAAAEQRGDLSAAMTSYTTLLGKYPAHLADAAAVLDRAIDDALKMRPAPAPTADALHHVDAAAAAIKGAKTQADFDNARLEYQKALAASPWWSDAWYNLGALDERLGHSDEARFAFETYLRATPSAPDRPAIEAKIAALKAKTGH
ncbi:MAG TPA: tetratricopeptide repeat protein [Alphaproteobacteria bacterium]|nr:tetratricopeptide repeat protein [Alphaproteobacteria bacterium]